MTKRTGGSLERAIHSAERNEEARMSQQDAGERGSRTLAKGAAGAGRPV
ncbi:hypothetical protein OMR58_04850 [Erwinia sp. INIA-01]|nr:hypothetical protein [Erwinia sp. INIA01]MCW1873771.1 hypothetical protein [Erwinia sp. INIA01]